MRTRSYTTEGIVLAKKNYAEADRIISVFTKDLGKLSLLAKGVRRPKSRKRGSLEVFSRIKISVVRSKTFPLITEAETINSYSNIRKDLAKVAVAYSFMETVNKTSRDEEENLPVYNALCEYLDKLRISDNLKSLRLQFVYDILVYSGFWPVGQKMPDPDKILEEVIEGRMATNRVGKKILQK